MAKCKNIVKIANFPSSPEFKRKVLTQIMTWLLDSIDLATVISLFEGINAEQKKMTKTMCVMLANRIKCLNWERGKYLAFGKTAGKQQAGNTLHRSGNKRHIFIDPVRSTLGCLNNKLCLKYKVKLMPYRKYDFLVYIFFVFISLVFITSFWLKGA